MLPQELLDCIFSSFEEPFRRGDPDSFRALAACSLACRTFREACQPLLYESVSFIVGPKENQRTLQLAEILANNPNLSSSIAHLRLYVCVPCSNKDVPTDDPARGAATLTALTSGLCQGTSNLASLRVTLAESEDQCTPYFVRASRPWTSIAPPMQRALQEFVFSVTSRSPANPIRVSFNDSDIPFALHILPYIHTTALGALSLYGTGHDGDFLHLPQASDYDDDLARYRQKEIDRRSSPLVVRELNVEFLSPWLFRATHSNGIPLLDWSSVQSLQVIRYPASTAMAATPVLLDAASNLTTLGLDALQAEEFCSILPNISLDIWRRLTKLTVEFRKPLPFNRLFDTLSLCHTSNNLRVLEMALELFRSWPEPCPNLQRRLSSLTPQSFPHLEVANLKVSCIDARTYDVPLTDVEPKPMKRAYDSLKEFFLQDLRMVLPQLKCTIRYDDWN